MHATRFPLLLAALALTCAFAAALLAPRPAAAAECGGAQASPSKLSKREASKSILCLLNKERAQRGMKSLDLHGDQEKAAQKHTRVMMQRNCFSHQCPGEADLTSRLSQADYLPCDCSWGVGENLAYGESSTGSPRKIVAAWMNSPGHRANILNGQYEDIGIGIIFGTPGSGPDRNSATYTTDFGYRE